ncbi:Zinc finger FYVE domain-containing protein 19 [Habropoda laboriosa]|uniref:Zinc finger FYVE domain-containing protein 19 n=1 Tax=Habropoda laboriosa TaxID=597456 RepID=A0A0L7RFG1_9HYME|nr:PREDICTED: abscission/NoCut checkpoint regulator [Habropoda laboriosa]KOC69461.1 Zinc finger FYVE domain-containing protein 19 [Habropoda laboriosa]
MSCNICQTKFSFFTREDDCPGCGFSCCSKCLKYKCDIPDKGVKKTCGRCFYKRRFKNMSNSNNNSTMLDEQEKPIAPVDITKKLDSLENPVKPPIVMYKHTNHWDKFKKGLEPADQEIVDRLRKLKEEDKTTALSVDEIRKRLALLKDEDPNASHHKINIHEVDNRTDQQKTDDLLQEYLEQLELSSSSDSDTEIQSRLRSLQDVSDKPSKHSTNDMDDDDETHISKKLIAKILAEANLSKYEADVDELEEEAERPTCAMCGQTKPSEGCSSYDDEIYCAECLKKEHDDC